ncbi:hypothetical protein [Dyadobacter frigoris]|uniref:Lipoprotein n=1 Tax=Dyadobacter frigoris TaxID=2576211 RepID=A0A4U6DC54_9BACT|nr:hypothetical protein [Dyadobacter frigoris]TKT93947.1 hypothetical protein FDK13_01680 [Dyadobacter frigoris]GLU50835.1 hypothetical protein Dfri01_02960 [Dyadobacter frigoris]
MNRILYCLAFGLLLSGCNNTRVENTKELSNEIKASKIVRVTNTQLIYTVDEWGKKISKLAQKSLEEALAKNPEKAAELCKNPSGIPIIGALEKKYGVKISLLGPDDTKNAQLDKKEIELLEAYLYSAKSNASSLSDNVQPINDTTVVYNVPADLQICKICLADKTPSFALWRLLFDKKEILRKVDVKTLKD